MNITRNPPEATTKQLLIEAQLPVKDITPEHLEHFFGAWSGTRLDGVVGLELYQSVALLRSLAVITARQRSGLGAALVSEAERYAAEQGTRSLFLLTTTAKNYFEQRGYLSISRASAPKAIRATAEFSSICPASAVFMVKHIPANPALAITERDRHA